MNDNISSPSPPPHFQLFKNTEKQELKTKVPRSHHKPKVFILGDSISKRISGQKLSHGSHIVNKSECTVHYKQYFHHTPATILAASNCYKVEGISSQHHRQVKGDGQCDSSRHSAKYGTYTLMDLESGQIVDIQLVHVSI